MNPFYSNPNFSNRIPINRAPSSSIPFLSFYNNQSYQGDEKRPHNDEGDWIDYSLHYRGYGIENKYIVKFIRDKLSEDKGIYLDFSEGFNLAQGNPVSFTFNGKSGSLNISSNVYASYKGKRTDFTIEIHGDFSELEESIESVESTATPILSSTSTPISTPIPYKPPEETVSTVIPDVSPVEPHSQTIDYAREISNIIHHSPGFVNPPVKKAVEINGKIYNPGDRNVRVGDLAVTRGNIIDIGREIFYVGEGKDFENEDELIDFLNTHFDFSYLLDSSDSEATTAPTSTPKADIEQNPSPTPTVALAAPSTPGLTSIPAATSTPVISLSYVDSKNDRDILYENILPDYVNEIESGNPDVYVKINGFEIRNPILQDWDLREHGLPTRDEYTFGPGLPVQDFEKGTLVLVNGVASFTSNPTATSDSTPEYGATSTPPPTTIPADPFFISDSLIYEGSDGETTRFTTPNGTHQIVGSDEFRAVIWRALQKLEQLDPEILNYAGDIKEATGEMLAYMNRKGSISAAPSFTDSSNTTTHHHPDLKKYENFKNLGNIAFLYVGHEISHLAGCNEEEAYAYMVQLARLDHNPEAALAMKLLWKKTYKAYSLKYKWFIRK